MEIHEERSSCISSVAPSQTISSMLCRQDCIIIMIVGKTIGRTIEKHQLPVYVERFGQLKDEIIVTASDLRKELGNDEFEKIPTGTIGLYTYYERLVQGLHQLMYGAGNLHWSIFHVMILQP